MTNDHRKTDTRSKVRAHAAEEARAWFWGVVAVILFLIIGGVS